MKSIYLLTTLNENYLLRGRSGEAAYEAEL